MKKIILTILMLCVLGTSTNFMKKAQADTVNFGVGLTTFYTAWKPSFRGLYIETETGGGFILGPLLTVTIFNRVTFGAVFM